MNGELTFEQKRSNYENHGYADPDYCARVLRDMAAVRPESLLDPDEDLGTGSIAGLLGRCFDAEFAQFPRTFSNCAANCERLLDKDRHDDFDDLLYCMDRSMHDVYERVFLSRTALSESPLRNTEKARAGVRISRFLLLSLDGLRDGLLALAADSERDDIDRLRQKLADPDMGIRCPAGGEGPVRVIDAMAARYRNMQASLNRHANRIGYSILVFPFLLESFRTAPGTACPKNADDAWIDAGGWFAGDEWTVEDVDIP